MENSQFLNFDPPFIQFLLSFIFVGCVEILNATDGVCISDGGIRIPQYETALLSRDRTRECLDQLLSFKHGPLNAFGDDFKELQLAKKDVDNWLNCFSSFENMSQLSMQNVKAYLKKQSKLMGTLRKTFIDTLPYADLNQAASSLSLV